MPDEPNNQQQQPNDNVPEWKQSLPEQLREAPFFAKAENLESVVTEITHAAAHMGNSIRIPGEDASDDDRVAARQKVLERFPDLILRPNDDNANDFYNSLGRPESHDKYEFTPPEGQELPEDLSKFAEAAHEAGLTQKQYNSVLSAVLGDVYKNQEIAQNQQNDEMKALQGEWGAAFEGKVNTVKNFLRLSKAPEGILDLVENDAMSPTEIKWLLGLAEGTQNPTELAGQNGNLGGSDFMTPQEAQEAINDIMGNPQHAYFNPMDPLNKAAMEKMVKLHRIKNGERIAL